MTKKIKIDITTLWGLWHKGRATGSFMQARGMEMSDIDMGYANYYAHMEMHKDIAALIGEDTYRKAAKDSGFEIPEKLSDD